MLTIVPTEFECTDDTGELIFKISAFDECCSTLEIKSVVAPESWPEISRQIMRCLDSMNPPATADLSEVEQLIMRLSRYNEWRRGADFEQPEPAQLGRDIDETIQWLRKLI